MLDRPPARLGGRASLAPGPPPPSPEECHAAAPLDRIDRVAGTRRRVVSRPGPGCRTRGACARRAGQRQGLDRRAGAAVGAGPDRRRRPHRGGRNGRGHPRGGRHGARRRPGQPAGRAGLHRLARALHRGRLPAGVGAVARRGVEGHVRRAHRRAREDPARGRLAHGRRLGPQPVGRRTAHARVDRCGHAGPPGLDQPPRWSHGAGQQRGAEGGGRHARLAGRGRRHDRARRRWRTDRRAQGQRDGAGRARGAGARAGA